MKPTVPWVGVGVLIAVSAAVTGCARLRLASLGPPVVRTLETTGYCKCGKCCGWHRRLCLWPVYSSGPLRGKPKKVGVTASGTRARPGTIAADPSRYPFGTLMYVPGYGYGRVEDTGRDIRGDRIDLYFRTHQQALNWGRRRLEVKIWFP